LREQRRFKRLKLPGVIKCHVRFVLDGEDRTGVPVVSLSAGGMFAILEHAGDRELSVGTKIRQVGFQLDEIQDIVPDGEIVYRLDTGSSVGYGIAFIGLTGPQIRRMDEYVNSRLRGRDFIMSSDDEDQVEP